MDVQCAACVLLLALLVRLSRCVAGYLCLRLGCGACLLGVKPLPACQMAVCAHRVNDPRATPHARGVRTSRGGRLAAANAHRVSPVTYTRVFGAGPHATWRLLSPGCARWGSGHHGCHHDARTACGRVLEGVRGQVHLLAHGAGCPLREYCVLWSLQGAGVCGARDSACLPPPRP